MISDYQSLREAVSLWLADTSVSASVPDFIALGESRLWDDVRAAENEQNEQLTVTGQRYPLPPDFLEQRSLVRADGYRLDYKDPNTFWREAALYEEDGNPRIYTIEASNYVFLPYKTEATQVLATYYFRFPNLNLDTDTNAVLQRYPGLYLYGALLEAEPFLGNDPRALTWATMYDENVKRANETQRARIHPAGQIRSSGVREARWRN